MALTDKLTAIADAIRGKTGKTDALTLEQMPGEIEGIQTGGGSGGIGAVKFVDVDITVEASTTTAVTYTVDDIEIVTTRTNPVSVYDWANINDVYIITISPKEIGEPTGTEKNIFRGLFSVGKPNTNYIQSLGGMAYGSGGLTNVGQSLNAIVYCSKIVDGKLTGYVNVTVKHHASNGYNVLPGTYNVKVFLVTDFNWRFDT